MRYTMIEEKDGAIEIIGMSRASANVKIQALIEDGGRAVGYIDSPLQVSYLRAGLEKRERQRKNEALGKLNKIKAFVYGI